MNHYNCIKKIYPEIRDSDFLLYDDLDEKGVYIKKWIYSQPQPTQAELKAVYPQVLKEQKLRELKRSIASQVIYLKAPTFKQTNVGLGIYDAATAAPIVKWIKAGRQAVQEIEDKINLAISITEIEAIIFSFDSLMIRAEKIFTTL